MPPGTRVDGAANCGRSLRHNSAFRRRENTPSLTAPGGAILGNARRSEREWLMRFRQDRGLSVASRVPVSDRGTLGGLTQFLTQFGFRAQPLARKLLILKIRRDVRVVEGARLESVCRGNSTVGSNPTLSATL